jgi:hypothetical protein
VPALHGSLAQRFIHGTDDSHLLFLATEGRLCGRIVFRPVRVPDTTSPTAACLPTTKVSSGQTEAMSKPESENSAESGAVIRNRSVGAIGSGSTYAHPTNSVSNTEG